MTALEVTLSISPPRGEGRDTVSGPWAVVAKRLMPGTTPLAQVWSDASMKLHGLDRQDADVIAHYLRVNKFTERTDWRYYVMHIDDLSWWSPLYESYGYPQ